MAENTSEDDLLIEDISVENKLEGMATGSKSSSSVLSENAELIALLTSKKRNDESHERIAPLLRGNAYPQTGRLCQMRSKDQ